MYSALDIAKHICTFCRDRGHAVTNLKLQKILYFLWIRHYENRGTYLFDAPFVAWGLGPVQIDVYEAYKSNGSNIIVRTDDVDLGELNSFVDGFAAELFNVSAGTLVNRSHRPGGAWDSVWDSGNGKNATLPFSLVIELECSVSSGSDTVGSEAESATDTSHREVPENMRSIYYWNMSRLELMRGFSENWDDEGGMPFSPELIDAVEELIADLRFQPSVSPTGRASIQLDYGSRRKGQCYLGFEIYDNGTVSLYTKDAKGNHMEKNIRIGDITTYVSDFCRTV